MERYIIPQGTDVASGARHHMETITRLGGEIIVASTQGSLPARFEGEDGKNVFPLHLEKSGRITISFGWTHERPGLRDEARRQELLDRFAAALGGLSTSNLKGHPAFPVTRLLDERVRAAYEAVAKDYIALAIASERSAELSAQCVDDANPPEVGGT